MYLIVSKLPMHCFSCWSIWLASCLVFHFSVLFCDLSICCLALLQRTSITQACCYVAGNIYAQS